MIEVQRLDAIVRADTVCGCRSAEARRVGRFIRLITTMAVGFLDQRIVYRLRNNVISLAHGLLCEIRPYALYDREVVVPPCPVQLVCKNSPRGLSKRSYVCAPKKSRCACNKFA